MRKKLTAVLPAAAMFAYALAGTTGIAQNVYAADEEETLTVWCWDPTFNVYAMKQAEAAYQKDHPNFKLDIQEKVYSDKFMRIEQEDKIIIGIGFESNQDMTQYKIFNSQGIFPVSDAPADTTRTVQGDSARGDVSQIDSIKSN